MRWHLLLTPAMGGVDNMALDDALMTRARRTGEGVVRVYSWIGPTLSLGRNQRARGAFDSARAAAQGVGIVRRVTGGRALLHHREITYSVTAPIPPTESLMASYHRINTVLVRALRALGVPVTVAHSADRFLPPDSAPCFERPANGELAIGGRKLVGSAQLREHDAYLQHGSILVHDDQAQVQELAAEPLPVVAPAATLFETLGRDVSAGEVAEVLFAKVRTSWDPSAAPLAIDEATLADMEGARARFASASWTWRR